jgi:pimeloyl-ACP methyl ester carboxylesterase
MCIDNTAAKLLARSEPFPANAVCAIIRANQECIPMILRNLILFVAGCLVGAALIAFPLLMNGTQSPTVRVEANAPLALAQSGVFYAGGRYDKDHPDQHYVGQMYVEYQIPAVQTHPFPIVLIHGGGQTGAGWWTTSDGRPGWAPYFVRRGYAVYVVDQVARGRSPFSPEVYGEMSAQPLGYVVQKFTAQEKDKLWPQAALHTQWPGTGEPGDPTFDQYWASNIPGMENRVMQAQMNIDALAALLDRVGPAIILVHSQSGAYAWPLAQMRPTLVKAIVAAEPSGPPVHDVVVKSIQRFDVAWEGATKQTDDDYFRDNPGVKHYGLGNTPLDYVPTVTADSPLQFVQQDKPERRDLSRCWLQKEPARKLPLVGERPVLLIEAEASFYAGYNHCNVAYLRQASVPVEFIKLADIGIKGNGHMMMMEKNSDEIARVIADWLDKVAGSIQAQAR